MTSWWRSWHGAPTDAKWLLIASKAKVAPGMVAAIFWALCDFASQQEDRGSVSGFDSETYAAFSGFDLAQIDSVIAALNEKQLIANGRLTAWEKRQPLREDETATDRKRKQRHEASRAVTLCHAPERTEQIEQRERTDARALDLCKEIAKIYGAAGHLPPDTGRAHTWLAQGLDPAIIKAAIAERVVKGKPAKPLPYFDPILAELHAKKIDVPQVTPESEKKFWDRLLDHEAETGKWSSTRTSKSEIPAAHIEDWKARRGNPGDLTIPEYLRRTG